MHKAIFAIAAVAALLTTPGLANDFEFDAELEGDGEFEWNFEATQSWDTTFSSGAEFSFNGGAGTDGSAIAKGDFTGVGGYFYEAAGGEGDAYSNTNGTNWATASFGSESYTANGGFAADLEWGDPAKISYSGLVTAGGAGAVETGLTYGFETTYQNYGVGSYDIDADLSGSYSD